MFDKNNERKHELFRKKNHAKRKNKFSKLKKNSQKAFLFIFSKKATLFFLFRKNSVWTKKLQVHENKKLQFNGSIHQGGGS